MLVRVQEPAPAPSQALLILLFHLQLHTLTHTAPPRHHPPLPQNQGRACEQGPPPPAATATGSSDRWSMRRSANQVCTINLVSVTLTDIGFYDTRSSQSRLAHLLAGESATEIQHSNTHIKPRESWVWMQYANIITLLCLLWKTMAAGSWHSNAQGKPFPGQKECFLF